MRTNLKDEIIEKVEDNIKNDAEWIPENPDFNPYDLGKKRKNSNRFCKKRWMETLIGSDFSIFYYSTNDYESFFNKDSNNY
mgnify:FL=1